MDALLSSKTLKSAITVVLFFLVAVRFLTGKKRRPAQPQKKYYRVVGTSLHLLFNFQRLHDYLTRLSAKHTTFRMISLFRSDIFTVDPAVVEHILKTNFDNYGKGLQNYRNLSDLLGDGIFTVDGDKWRQQRKVSSHEFSTRVLRDFSSQIFKQNAAKLANVLAEAATNNQIVDIQDLFMKSTLDSIFRVAFGVDLDSMCGSNEEGAKFSHAFDEASSFTSLRFVDVLWPIKKYLNIGVEAKLKKNVEIVNNFVYKLIQNKVQQMQNLGNASMKKDDILSRFIQLGDVDPLYLRDIILNFIIAGKDTTAATLSWFISLLCKHPQIQEKLSQEIKNATNVDTISNYAEFLTNLQEDSLERMHYLHAALTETLRLYPAVPADPKVSFSDDTLPDGFSVNKGDMVYYHPYAMGRMKSLWGDDAECFRPERWLSEEGFFQQESPFKFTAFQAGPRMCLGKEFAYRQMKIFSAVLLGSFRFRLGDENKPVNYKMMINLHIDGGLHVEVLYR
ncbi:hypothetical protein V2J09_018292 [Rumex salicifolius]